MCFKHIINVSATECATFWHILRYLSGATTIVNVPRCGLMILGFLLCKLYSCKIVRPIMIFLYCPHDFVCIKLAKPGGHKQPIENRMEERMCAVLNCIAAIWFMQHRSNQLQCSSHFSDLEGCYR